MQFRVALSKSCVASGVLVGLTLLCSCGKPSGSAATRTGAGANATSNSISAAIPPAPEVIPAMEANQSVVVVKDLGFGRQAPVLESVLKEIERRSQPEGGGQGRTFAILEAFTQTDTVTSNLNLCLRISSEKPGIAEIVYNHGSKPQTLWKNRITPATHKSGFTGGALTIYFDAGDGKSFLVDGSMNPTSIFDAMLKEPGIPVAQAWPEGEVRELSFVYSACGCPIHVKSRRVGQRTVRTEQESQVIFPDDPAAMQVISRLMGW